MDHILPMINFFVVVYECSVHCPRKMFLSVFANLEHMHDLLRSLRENCLPFGRSQIALFGAHSIWSILTTGNVMKLSHA